MWLKAIHYNNMDIAEQILKTTDPKKAKSLGRKVKGFNAEDWITHSFSYMLEVNIAKYSQNEEERKFLLSTGDKTLVEASPYDKIWGIGLHYDDDDVLDEHKWQGMNLLGKVLMHTRTKMKNKFFIRKNKTNIENNHIIIK